MDMLKLALEARLPFIHVTTDDILHVREILTHLVGGAAVNGFEAAENLDEAISGADYFFVSSDGVATGKLYRVMKNANKSLVFVNTKTSVLHFHGGTMLPPKEMILSELKKHTNAENAEEILTAFGGMTLKDTFEVIRLTLERDGKLTATGCNRRIEIKSMIDRHGHMMLGVAAKPSFTYTIGLSEKYGFELIMVGLRYEFAAQILNDVADHMKAGNSLDLEKEYSDFTNLPARFRMCDIEKAAEYVVQAENYYGHPVNVVQLVMCDREGRFPEDSN